ncbi:hypothetical protein [Vibrio phage vB_VpaP_SJSY21]|nr:hypothetical protein [Vibrio phage vB_VpaP_SJSY21]
MKRIKLGKLAIDMVGITVLVMSLAWYSSGYDMDCFLSMTECHKKWGM